MPLGLNQICVAIQNETTVNLLADETKRALGFQPESIKDLLQEFFESIPAFVWRPVSERHERSVNHVEFDVLEVSFVRYRGGRFRFVAEVSENFLKSIVRVINFFSELTTLVEHLAVLS